jgi:hypothetical protein
MLRYHLNQIRKENMISKIYIKKQKQKFNIDGLFKNIQ